MDSKVLNSILCAKIIPVYNSDNLADAKNIIDVCYQAGLRVFEFTNRNESALSVFKDLVNYTKNYPDFYLGIGTIFSPDDALKFIDCGANFIVSPILSYTVLDFCKQKNVLYIPGCGTVTEAYNAYQQGCKLIKVFPANVLGLAFAEAIKSVLPKINLMPTGGINPIAAEIIKWQKAGVSCVGIGSKLFDADLLKAKKYGDLTLNIKQLLAKV